MHLPRINALMVTKDFFKLLSAFTDLESIKMIPPKVVAFTQELKTKQSRLVSTLVATIRET
jgi:hypothetical protein